MASAITSTSHRGGTATRIARIAGAQFGTRGVAATSLDDVARELGLTKQTVLYHYGSKEGLVRAVTIAGAERLMDVLDEAAEGRTGWEQIESVVRAAFGLAVAQPELIGLLREVSRLGPPVSTGVAHVLRPLLDRAMAALDGHVADPQITLISIYATVAGVVTDAEALRAVGLDLDSRAAVRLRRHVLDTLRAVMGQPERPVRSTE